MSQQGTEESARERARSAVAELDRLWALQPAAPRLRRLVKAEEFKRLVARIERATGTRLPCLIEGPASEVPALIALTVHQTGARRSGPFVRVRGFLPPADWHTAVEAAGSGSLLISEAQLLSDEDQRLLLGHLEGEDPRILVSVTSSEGLQEDLARRLAVLRITLGERQARAAGGPPSNASLEAIEQQAIAARLREFGWQMQRTAASLGIDRKTLYRKIKRYGLEADS